MSRKRKNYTGYTYDEAKQNLKEMHLEDYPKIKIGNLQMKKWKQH